MREDTTAKIIIDSYEDFVAYDANGKTFKSEEWDGTAVKYSWQNVL